MGSGASWPLSTVDLIIDDSIDGVVYGVRGFMASQHRGPDY